MKFQFSFILKSPIIYEPGTLQNILYCVCSSLSNSSTGPSNVTILWCTAVVRDFNRNRWDNEGRRDAVSSFQFLAHAQLNYLPSNALTAYCSKCFLFDLHTSFSSVSKAAELSLHSIISSDMKAFRLCL